MGEPINMRAVWELMAYKDGRRSRDKGRLRIVPTDYEDPLYAPYWLKGYDLEPIDAEPQQ